MVRFNFAPGYQVAFAEFYGRHPSKLIPVFAEMRRAHLARRLAPVIEFPLIRGAAKKAA